jgi:cell division protein ZapA (FtsZ GTPase activity inhibitor)
MRQKFDDKAGTGERVVTIELFGQLHTFKSDNDVAEAKKIADLLVKEVQKVKSQFPSDLSPVSKQAILILAALNIASNHFELKREYSQFIQQISSRSKNLLQRIDTGLS